MGILRWLRQALPRPVTPRELRCPHCGEDRLVEREGGGGYCAVCGRVWALRDEERQRLDGVMGRRH